MRERLIPHARPDDDTLGSPKDGPEQFEKKRISDFIVETKKTGTNEESRFLDSIRLQEAIETGVLSEEEIITSFQTTHNRTLAGSIENLQQLMQKDPNSTFGREIEKLLAMQQARKNYIPMADNSVLALPTKDREQTIRDIIDWIKSNKAVIYDGAYSDQKISEEKLFERLSDDDAKRMSRAAHIEASLDYPALSHGIRVDTMYTDKLGNVNLLFYGHGQLLEGGVHCDADVVSALKVLNHFKKKGYAAELDLTMNPAQDGDTRVTYLAR